MTKAEMFSTYVLPVLAAALTALAGFLGTQLKALYRRWVDDKTKEAVVRTCVKAVEQLYHDLGGPEKLEKAREGVRQILEEKGISISQLEMDLLIESVVSEFNYSFAKAGDVPKSDTPSLVGKEPEPPKAAEYSEEEGASL